MRFISTTTKILLVASFVALAVMPTGFAHAADPVPATSTSPSPGFLTRASNVISNVVQAPTNIMLFSIFFVLSKGVALFAQLFNAVLRYTIDPNMIVIVTLWRIIRDLCNMMFIVVLIIMAFSTIFDLDSLGVPGISGAKASGALIVKFIIAALLINFSLTIGGLIITGADSVNKIFLSSIGNVSDRLGQAILPASSILQLKIPSVQESLDAAASIAKTTTEQGGLTLTLKLISAIILSFILLFFLITAVVFVVWRLPYLMYLLITSPVAWLATILPSTRSFSKKWWSEFIGWNIYLPVFLFFLYIGMYILSQEQLLVTSFAGQNSQTLTDQFVSGLSLPLSTIFYYILVGFVLVGSTKIARDAAKGGGDGVVSAIEAGRNFAYGLPVFSHYQAAEVAAGERYKQFKKEGFSDKYGFRIPGTQTRVTPNTFFGGTDAQKAKEQAFKSRFGVKGSGEEFVGEGNKLFEDVEKDFNSGKLSTSQLVTSIRNSKATTARGFAYRKLAAKVGVLDDATFAETITSLRKNPRAMKEFVKQAAETDFANIQGLKDMASGAGAYSAFASPEFIGARQEISRRIQENAKVLGEVGGTRAYTLADLEAGVQQFGGANTVEGGKYLKNVGKVRPDLVYDYEIAHPPTGRPTRTRQRVFSDFIKDPKDFVKMPVAIWSDPDFSTALSRVAPPVATNPKAYDEFKNRIANALIDAPDGALKIPLLNAALP